MPLEELAARCGACLLGSPSPGAGVTCVSQDTRRLPPGAVYVALRGEHFDGHEFVARAAAAGAAGAIVSDRASFEAPEDFPLLAVDDPLAAFHRLAASWRSELGARVAAVTGSSGKTSVKEMIASILGRHGRVAATEGNLNNHIGLPLSILAANREDEFAVWEMGMNHAGEIRVLAELSRPDVSTITNIGTAHIEFLGSREAIAREKAELFLATSPGGACIFPSDDDFALLLASAAGNRARPVGFDSGDPSASDIRTESEGVAFTLLAAGQSHRVRLPVAGVHMVRNALLAARVAMEFGVPPQEIASGLSATRIGGGRMRRLDIRGVTFLDDSYNANPDSMEAALLALSQLPSTSPRPRRIAILGAMGELGEFEAEGCARVGRRAAACADAIVVVGERAGAIGDHAKSAGLREVLRSNTCEGAAALLRSITRPGDIVLLKGSRSARMEEVLDHLD